MRVLIVTAFPYPHIGGVSSYIDTLRDEGSKHGVEFDVLSLSPPRFSSKITAGLESLLLGRRRAWARHQGRRLAQLAHQVDAVIRAGQYDVLNPQSVWGMNAILQSNLGRTMPTLLTVHGYAADEATFGARSEQEANHRRRIMRRYEELAYTGASHILTVDTRIADAIQSTRADGIQILLNRPGRAFFSTNDGAPFLRGRTPVTILCPRRLVRKNGVRYAIEAIAVAKQRGLNLKLVVAGDGPERAQLEKLTQDLGLLNEVEFLGSVERDQMPELYRKADLVVVPSITYENVQEASSISALEAMAMGRVVIASAIGGLKELIESGQTGYLVPEQDSTSIADTIEELIEQPDRVVEVAERARDTVRSDSERWFGYYRQALEQAQIRSEEMQQ